MKRIAIFLVPVRALLIFSIAFSIPLLGCEPEKQIWIGFIGGITGRVAGIGVSASFDSALLCQQIRKISFDQYGDVKQSNAAISVVRNRKFVIVE